MRIQYYSDMLNQYFDTEAAAIEAEKAEAEKRALIEKAKAEKEAKAKKAVEERKARAKEIEAAHKAMIEAEKTYNTLVDAFVKDFCSYHMTYSSSQDLDGLINHIFRIL